MSVVYFILMLIACGFIASPLTMIVIYFFYKIYLNNVKAAFTQSIIGDKYKDLNHSEESIKLLEDDSDDG